MKDTSYFTMKRSIILKFKHRIVFLSIYSTNLAKNHSSSTSFVLTLEQNMLITIAFWQPLLFMLSPCFLSISVLSYTFLRLWWSKRLGFKNTRKLFLVPFFLFSYNIRLILPNFLKRILSCEEIIWS